MLLFLFILDSYPYNVAWNPLFLFSEGKCYYFLFILDSYHHHGAWNPLALFSEGRCYYFFLF